MENATVVNEVQVIQGILEEYLGNRISKKLAVKIYDLIHKETQHTHKDRIFYIYEDGDGALILTKKSQVKKSIQLILKSYLEEDEMKECIEQIMNKDCRVKKATEFETIKIPDASSPIYAKLIKHMPVNNEEMSFIDTLRRAINKSIKGFEVFVNDPSIVNGNLQFIPGFKPAVGYSYNELEELAKENGLRLGTKYEYIMFLGWLINSLVNDGWSEATSWKAVCTNSSTLGHYHNSEDAKGDFEVTGSREVQGKCDLVNTYKVLAKDDEADGFWIAGGFYRCYSEELPLAHLAFQRRFYVQDTYSVGWFVR